MISVDSLKKVYCVGIGGIGLSALALLLKEKGIDVSGADATESHITENLKKRGVTVHLGFDAAHVPPDADCIVYSLAWPEDNVERAQAAQYGLPSFSYPQMLGLVSATLKTVAVSGTHGKTTTTAMIATMAIDCAIDPTIVVGSFMNDPKSGDAQKNFIAGKSDWLIVEACEYRRSFLNLSPFILVITMVDADHLDYYKDLADIKDAFLTMAMKVPVEGALVYDVADTRNQFLLDAKRDGHIVAHIVDYGQYIKKVPPLRIPGEHNRRNAAAGLAVMDIIFRNAAAGAVSIGSESVFSKAQESIATFKGTWRRFEYKGKANFGVPVYDDYAHHPAEIRATLQGARELYSKARIHAVFQPHLFSRTKDLFDEFINAFDDADYVYLLPIYAAREAYDPTITSDMLVQALLKKSVQVIGVTSHESAVTALQQAVKEGNLSPTDVVITMGAGDVNKVADMLVSA